eukprot:NODE_126_length_17250_cov_2.558743.p14 type:complete len:151 gc:universal NODE_126_length_17250_cov_2.558743:12226-11774(-)
MNSQRKVFFPSAIFRLVLNSTKAKNEAQFMVPLHFNKLDIKDYLKQIYEIDCLKVNTMIMHINKDRSRRDRKRYKKAIVTLTEDIDLPSFTPDIKHTDIQAYEMRPFFENFRHPSRMFFPYKGRNKFVVRQVESMTKKKLLPLLKDPEGK